MSVIPHQQVLINKTREIVEGLSDPRKMAGVTLKTFLADSDRQWIDCEFERHGPQRATQIFVLLLEKREEKVYRAFVNALRSPFHKREALADELDAEEQSLVGGDVKPVGRSASPQPNPTQRVARDCARDADGQETVEINMLLKDIPVNVYQKIVNLLNWEDSLRKNWLAIAGCMKLSVEDTMTLKQSNKMEGLFYRMIHRNMRVKDLVGFLAHEDVDRRDVIDELKKAGIV